MLNSTDITLKGGFNAGYTANTDPSSILHGSLTVKLGTLTVEKVTIKPLE
jgi:hypothetical protein